MMTSGYAVMYNDAFHCFAEVIKKEGMRSLFKGAGANIVRVSCCSDDFLLGCKCMCMVLHVTICHIT